MRRTHVDVPERGFPKKGATEKMDPPDEVLASTKHRMPDHNKLLFCVGCYCAPPQAPLRHRHISCRTFGHTVGSTELPALAPRLRGGGYARSRDSADRADCADLAGETLLGRVARKWQRERRPAETWGIPTDV